MEPMPVYLDNRPATALRLEAQDHGVVLRHGDGPDSCDIYGARDVWVYEDAGTYYMHYDAAGATGWLAALATSTDGVTWTKHGRVLELGAPSSDDGASASYGLVVREGTTWHMFYVGTPNTSPPPDLIPALPYMTLKARADAPFGPWRKQPEVVPFRPQPGSYYANTASPGAIVRRADDEYLQFFSAAVQNGTRIERTIGLARTHDLDGPWTVEREPIVPLAEQIENSSLYYEPTNETWFLFTNHVGITAQPGLVAKGVPSVEYTDAIWVYWSCSLDRWDARDKAVVLDRHNCHWSPHVVGLPSVLPIGGRLAIFYDGLAEESIWHMRRDVGLAWLDLPLMPPGGNA
jgi:predicted GH43/DUF377 family glycosyl hydrolase